MALTLLTLFFAGFASAWFMHLLNVLALSLLVVVCALGAAVADPSLGAFLMVPGGVVALQLGYVLRILLVLVEDGEPSGSRSRGV